MQDLHNTSAVSAAALYINITQKTCEMTLFYIKIIKSQLWWFYSVSQIPVQVNVEIKIKCP
jgi:hypothetical protein